MPQTAGHMSYQGSYLPDTRPNLSDLRASYCLKDGAIGPRANEIRSTIAINHISTFPLGLWAPGKGQCTRIVALYRVCTRSTSPVGVVSCVYRLPSGQPGASIDLTTRITILLLHGRGHVRT